MRHSHWLVLAAVLACAPTAAQERKNWFDDPFVQVTSGLPGCTAPAPPGMTEEEMRAEAHVRAQHGNSCYRDGRCRLSNSYLYDKELIPRVAQFIRQQGRFEDTSVWILGERRLVTLMGCVRTREQAQALEKAVLQVDDVVGAINLLEVGTASKPRYRAATP